MSNLVIPLSFKQNEKWLYEKIKKHYSYSGWIKEAIIEKIEKEENPHINNIPITSNFPRFNEDIM